MTISSKQWIVCLCFFLGPGACGPGDRQVDVHDTRGILDERGGAVHAGGVMVSAAPGVLASEVGIEIHPAEPPPGLHPGLRVVGAVEIEVDEPESLLLPLTIRMSYSDHSFDDEDLVLALHHSRTRGYEVVTLLDMDPQENTITFESRDFSVFVLVEALLPVPEVHSVGFHPGEHGWQIMNVATPFDPEGVSSGMAAYAIWHFSEKTDPLFGRYIDDIAMLTSALVQMADSRYWVIAENVSKGLLNRFRVVNWYKRALYFTGKPLFLRIGRGHAGVLYGYNQEFFTFYDVNEPGREQVVSYGWYTFGDYLHHSAFSAIGLPSLSLAFYKQTSEQAEEGFPNSQIIRFLRGTRYNALSGEEVIITGKMDGAESLELAMTSGGYWRNNKPSSWLEVHEGQGRFEFSLPSEFDWPRLLFLAGEKSPKFATPAAVVGLVEEEPESCENAMDCKISCPHAMLLLNDDGVVLDGDTRYGSNDMENYKCQPGHIYGSPEHVWSYCAPRDGNIDVMLNVLDDEADLGLLLLEGRCTPENCDESHPTGLFHAVEKGHCYYIVVDGTNGHSGAYDLWLEQK